jgi:urocanate hydratase
MVTGRESAPGSGLDAGPQQAVVYRTYLKLQSKAAERFSGTLAGKLVLGIGFGQHGAETALATAIAGGAFLGIERDPQILKGAVRNGSCDFMVNTLDESLRVLKNELRKRKPLSVGLVGDAAEILQAMIERGVQPDLIAGTSPWEAHRAALTSFLERGAEMLTHGGSCEGAAEDEVVWTAANLQDLRRMDKIALELIPAEDRVRRRWLEQAAGNFYRQVPLERVVGLRAEELEHFLDGLKNSGLTSAFQFPAMVRRLEAETWISPPTAS